MNLLQNNETYLTELLLQLFFWRFQRETNEKGFLNVL